MKIGILGGSFDPIHNGHLNMALKSYEQYHLDEVWLIPNGNAPHKDKDEMADAEDRLAMCRLVAKDYPFIQVCDIEIRSKEYSYTYITMTKLKEMYPEYEFYFIMGADSLDYFDKWRKPEIIASICKILVINRDEFSEEAMNEKIHRISSIFPADIQIVHCPKVDVSSTELRAKLNKNDVTEAVYDYICEHNLYGNSTIEDKLKLTLDSPRFEHTLGVMHTAKALATVYGYDENKAMLAGLLHDCAKCMTHEERVKLCEENQVEVTASEHENTAILHAKAGAILAKIEYHIEDIDVLHAIAVHTTGEPNMNTLDKIIYIADYIEPGRKSAPNLDYIRKLAYEDLDACMAQILEDTLKYLRSRGGNIDPTTAKAYEFYKEYRKEN